MSNYTETNPKGAKELLEAGQGWLYLDVRTVEEFDQGHVPGAYNVPILFRGAFGMQPNPDFVETVRRSFTPDTKLVLGCKAGGRSRRACELLAAEGYPHLVNMDGGFHGSMDEMGQIAEPGWQACGYEVALRPEPGRTWAELTQG